MNDLATDIAPAPEPVSTVIDTETETRPSGGGAPRTLPDDAKAPSLRETISAVVKEEESAREKPEAKPDNAEPEAKDAKEPKAEEKAPDKSAAERAADGKFVAKPKDEAAQADTVPDDAVAKAEEKSGEAKHYPEPPKNFLPDSKEMWRNVPRPVRRDLDVMVREHEAFREQTKVATERYESIRPFDELARTNGRDLRESLAKMNEVENVLRRDPIVGLNQILQEIGPRKADGSAISLFEVAQFVVNQGQDGYQQRMQQAQQAQPPQPDPKFVQAQQELAETKARLIAVEVIAPFKAAHPRYDELQEPIAQFLQSGMIPTSLSAPERLEAAYVMAERLHPSSSPPAETSAAPAPADRADDSLNGQKSIKSAPGAVSQDMEPERGGSIRELLQDEMRRQKRS